MNLTSDSKVRVQQDIVVFAGFSCIKGGIVDKINRVEVIDGNGRSYVLRGQNVKVTYDVQDEGRTLKIFIDENKPTESEDGQAFFNMEDEP